VASDDDETKGNMADIAKMVDELSGFTVMEVADLVKQLEAKWGVTPAAPVAVAAPGGGGGGAAARLRKPRLRLM
jgi:large subunit ribosomal protein L7/L12